MKIYLFSTAFVFMNWLTSNAQTKQYILYNKTTSADLHQNIPLMLDTTRRINASMDNVFKPTKGDYIVYRFIATYTGLSFTNKQKEFHDLLIVKTDIDNKIILAYQYTLEWADRPDVDLYESHCKHMYLKDGMTVKDFKFKNDVEYNRPFNETGIVKYE